MSPAPTAAAVAIRTRDGHGKATMTEGDAETWVDPVSWIGASV